MPTDEQNVAFLYSILKQHGKMQNIKWPDIAAANGIPNGHAARMRWHRFKQKMDGTAPQPRMPKDEPGTDTKQDRKRKAKDDAYARAEKKRKEIEGSASEDDEEPLARMMQRWRKIKMEEGMEGDASDDEDVKTEIKQEVKTEEDTEQQEDEVGGGRVAGQHIDDGASVSEPMAVDEPVVGDEQAQDMSLALQSVLAATIPAIKDEPMD